MDAFDNDPLKPGTDITWNGIPAVVYAANKEIVCIEFVGGPLCGARRPVARVDMVIENEEGDSWKNAE